MALTISILLLLGAILFVVRFVRSRFGAVSDLPDSDLPDPDLSDEDYGGWPGDGGLGSPALRKGGPKRKVSTAEIEEPDES
jgi:hypothetical protein